MNMFDRFNTAVKNIGRKKYYHGSVRNITDGFLQPRKQFNHVQDGVVSGAFVTTNLDYAKFFPINRCVGNGQCHLRGKKIYLEKLRENITPVFYVYTVYETPDNHFVHDKGTEFYSEKPIKIAQRQIFNTAEEIEKLGYEIYVLNEPLKSKIDMESGDNFDAQQEMDNAIKQNRFHRVDVAKLIAEQSMKMTNQHGKTI